MKRFMFEMLSNYSSLLLSLNKASGYIVDSHWYEPFRFVRKMLVMPVNIDLIASGYEKSPSLF